MFALLCEPPITNVRKWSGMKLKMTNALILAMRGRHPESLPDKRSSHRPFLQRCELGSDTSNTITSVAKDNFVVELYEEDSNYSHRT